MRKFSRLALPLALAGILLERPRPIAACVACLVTRAEAEKILGVRLTEEQPMKGFGGSEVCWYVGPADQSLKFELHFGGRRGFQSYLKAFERVKGANPRPIRGVSEQAVFHSGQLTVLYEDYFFTIGIGMPITEAGRIEASSALARRVIIRLRQLGPSRAVPRSANRDHPPC